MTTIRGFELPDHLYYLIEKHVWIAPRGGGLARLGMTTVGYHLLRETLVRDQHPAESIGNCGAQG